MLIATITALILMGGSGANWMLELLGQLHDQVKAEIQDEQQRKSLLDIVDEMQSISKRYAKDDKDADSALLKLLQAYDTPVDDIHSAMASANARREQYQRLMIADRFRLLENADQQQWSRLVQQNSPQ